MTWSPYGKNLIYTSSKPNSTAERLNVSPFGKLRGKEVKFDRAQLDNEIDAKPQGYLLFKYLPEKLIRKVYPGSYFGSERYPDWKN